MTVAPPSPLKTLAMTLLFPGSVIVFVPCGLLFWEGFPHRPAFGVLQLSALLLLVPGIGLFLVCVFDFAFVGKGTPAIIAPPKRLVVQGPYRYVRNPMFVGMALILFGEALFFESVFLGVYAVMMPCVFHLYLLFHEEPELRDRFGQEYDMYCRRVGRWIPSYHPFLSSDEKADGHDEGN